jgi:ribosomal protein S4
MKQARQFITHKHICINNKKVNVPSYLVSAEEEFKISFADNSKLVDQNHPERIKREVEKLKEEVEKIEKKIDKDIKTEEGKEKNKGKIKEKKSVEKEVSKETKDDVKNG